MKALALVLLLAAASPAWAAPGEDSVDAAKDLYGAASYDDALAMLNRLHDGGAVDRRSVGLYRALCFMALGKTPEADRAMEELILDDPLYRPADADLSPRVRATFAAVRRRLLPAVIQQRYGQAKAAYEKQEYDAAAKGFGAVLDGLADPDAAAAAAQPPLADLKMLATGFRDLSVKAAAPPPPPPPPPAKPAEIAAAKPTPRVYVQEDANVVPPVIIRQDIPSFPPIRPAATVGVVEIVIDETGRVASASMRTPLFPNYDRLVLTAAKAWQYRPATVDGVPVKFRKLIQLVLKPTV